MKKIKKGCCTFSHYTTGVDVWGRRREGRKLTVKLYMHTHTKLNGDFYDSRAHWQLRMIYCPIFFSGVIWLGNSVKEGKICMQNGIRTSRLYPSTDDRPNQTHACFMSERQTPDAGKWKEKQQAKKSSVFAWKQNNKTHHVQSFIIDLFPSTAAKRVFPNHSIRLFCADSLQFLHIFHSFLNFVTSSCELLSSDLFMSHFSHFVVVFSCMSCLISHMCVLMMGMIFVMPRDRQGGHPVFKKERQSQASHLIIKTRKLT